MYVTRLSIATLLFCSAVSVAAVSAAEKAPADLPSAIGHYIGRKWVAEGVTPVERSTDAEFMRRVYLDLTGRIPRVSEARSFLNSTRGATSQRNAELRALLVDDLLSRPSAASYFSEKWARVLLGPRPPRQANDAAFRRWLRTEFQRNTAYDEMTRRMLTARGQVYSNGPALFYGSLRNEPAKVAANASRALLGVQIGCAQCHDHPFDHWKQDDFWGFAALFGRLQPASPRQPFAYIVKEQPSGELKHPETGEVVSPVFLGGKPLPSTVPSRIDAAAEWVTAADNPYFAKATVNRIWAMLMRRGLVEPVDDLGPHNPSSHPQLLDAMAAFFIDNNYNLRELLRGIVLSQTYQLTSRSDKDHADIDERLFSRMKPRQLSATELYDSIAVAAYKPETEEGDYYPALPTARARFITRFSTAGEQDATYSGGVIQALALLNGEVTSGPASVQSSRMIAALQGPFFNDQQRVEILFLATLSRLPTADESTRMLKHLQDTDAATRRQALGDMFWALLNSAGFGLNH